MVDVPIEVSLSRRDLSGRTRDAGHETHIFMTSSSTPFLPLIVALEPQTPAVVLELLLRSAEFFLRDGMGLNDDSVERAILIFRGPVCAEAQRQTANHRQISDRESGL